MIIAPEFNTDVVVRFSGHENRFSNWEEARLSYDLSYAAKTVAQGKALYKFFRIVKGKAYGFRIKDWLDYECVQADGVLRPVSGTNARTWRMYKQYINSPNFDERRIAKPVNNGSFQLYLNGSASGDAITVDHLRLGHAHTQDRNGRDLPVWRGCHRLGAGEVFLMNPDAPDSLDGRYFGSLPRTAITARLTPLWTVDDAITAESAHPDSTPHRDRKEARHAPDR